MVAESDLGKGALAYRLADYVVADLFLLLAAGIGPCHIYSGYVVLLAAVVVGVAAILLVHHTCHVAGGDRGW